MVHGLEIRVLGPLEVLRGETVIHLTARRHQIVLGLLATQPNRVVSMERLIAVLWGEDPPKTARAQIHICVSAIRGATGDPSCIQTHPAGYALRIDEENVDCCLFDRIIQDTSSADLEEALRLLDHALALWRGEAFQGLDGEALAAIAEGLEQRRLAAIEQRIETCLRLGREDAHEISELCASYPLRERFHAYKMIALYRAGRQAEALTAFQNARRILAAELGIDPGPELRALETSILNQDRTLDLPGRQSAESHKIRLVPHQLVAPPADFTGRAEQVEKLLGHLYVTGSDEDRASRTPLVLVTGMCGIGKTALAMEGAHRLVDAFPDGQLLARLDGSATRPAEVADILDGFLRTLGLNAKEIPDDISGRAAALRTLLGGKRFLIVLDDAASESQIMPLLPGLPGCAVLITSRRRLSGIPGVLTIELSALPDADAAALLQQVVADGRLAEDPRAVAEIVRFCGGLPLAVRIAGARLAAHPNWRTNDFILQLSGEQGRLDQFVHGDLGLRALLAVVYESLTVASRRLFRLLGLLSVPDFALWTAAAVTGSTLKDAARSLDGLVESRLLDVEVTTSGLIRYRFHDLVRLFAVERSAAEDPPDEQFQAVARVLDACLAVVRETHRKAYGGDYVMLGKLVGHFGIPDEELADLLRDPFDWFSGERLALVALIAQAAQLGMAEPAWNLAVSLVVFYESLIYYDDWRTTHEIALDVAQSRGDRGGEAAILCSLGSLAVARGDTGIIGGLLHALRLFEENSDYRGKGLALRSIAHFDRVRGSYESAFRRYQDAVAAFRFAEDKIGEAHALSGMALTFLEVEDIASAERYSDAALSLARACGNQRLQSQALHRMSEVCLAKKDYGRARRYLSEALALVRESKDRLGEAYVMTMQAAILLHEGEVASATAILADLSSLRADISDGSIGGRLMLLRARVAWSQGDSMAAESLMRAAADLFSSQGRAVWHDRVLMMISALRGGKEWASLGGPLLP